MSHPSCLVITIPASFVRDVQSHCSHTRQSRVPVVNDPVLMHKYWLDQAPRFVLHYSPMFGLNAVTSQAACTCSIIRSPTHLHGDVTSVSHLAWHSSTLVTWLYVITGSCVGHSPESDQSATTDRSRGVTITKTRVCVTRCNRRSYYPSEKYILLSN